jgi:trigger factor
MSIIVETLDKLERRITLTLASDSIRGEVQSRLKKLARTVKADGFRPGRVPMSVVTQRYGYSVQYDVMNDQVGQAFANAAKEARLRVAGIPRIIEKEPLADAPGQIAFDAVFEVYPEVKIGDLNSIEIERVLTEVNDGAIERTIEILRKQRRTFTQRPASEKAVAEDRVTIDFEGKLEGVPFDGGRASDFQFMIGEGQMLEAFDIAVRGMKTGESKTFALQFPDDYHGKEVAGKEADFLVTIKRIESQNLPEVNEDFARALGVTDGSLTGLRADIRKNLEREVRFRVQARNKVAAMDAVLKVSELDVPKVMVEAEIERMIEIARSDLKKRGVKSADKAEIPGDIFHAQAERRVRLGLIATELVRSNNLQAKPEQLQAYLEELAQSYDRPAEVVNYYLSDRQRMVDVEAIVVENNVADFVLSRVNLIDKKIPFEELMSA